MDIRTKLLTKAMDFGGTKHLGQLDDCGKDYFGSHCINVYGILMQVTNDENLLCAALLHDTIEDTDTRYEELVREFNKDIADLVMEVTHEGKKDSYGHYFPRLKTQRGIMLKFADRLSNISRMEAWDESRRQHYLKKSKFWKDGRIDGKND
jgi:(p)ppGpp synthase/HD superfamily hydrolase